LTLHHFIWWSGLTTDGVNVEPHSPSVHVLEIDIMMLKYFYYLLAFYFLESIRLVLLLEEDLTQVDYDYSVLLNLLEQQCLLYQ